MVLRQLVVGSQLIDLPHVFVSILLHEDVLLQMRVFDEVLAQHHQIKLESPLIVAFVLESERLLEILVDFLVPQLLRLMTSQILGLILLQVLSGGSSTSSKS